jgi:hypothetical protein
MFLGQQDVTFYQVTAIYFLNVAGAETEVLDLVEHFLGYLALGSSGCRFGSCILVNVFLTSYKGEGSGQGGCDGEEYFFHGFFEWLRGEKVSYDKVVAVVFGDGNKMI